MVIVWYCLFLLDCPFPVPSVTDSRLLMRLFWCVSFGISRLLTSYRREKKQGSHYCTFPWVLRSLTTSLSSVLFQTMFGLNIMYSFCFVLVLFLLFVVRRKDKYNYSIIYFIVCVCNERF